MRIRHGKFILTNSGMVEATLAEQDRRNEQLQDQLNVVLKWARAQLEQHQPYINDVDVSCVKPENLAGALAEKIAKNLWCSRCSNPWPCKHIATLRLLREAAGRNDAESLRAVAEAIAAIEAPKPRPGQIKVGL